MSMQDPVADMFTRIRNAQSAGHEAVSMPHSKLKEAIAKLLNDEGFVGVFEKSEAVAHKPQLTIQLRYAENRPVIEKINRISRPGIRRFVGYSDLPRVFGGYGVAIVSTSRGIMSAKQARAEKIGGEVIGEIW